MLVADAAMVDTLAKAVNCIIPCEDVQSAKVHDFFVRFHVNAVDQ